MKPRDHRLGEASVPAALDNLLYRAYPIAAAAYSNQLYNGPCVLDSLVVTIAGAAGYTWAVFDGDGPGGTLIFSGDATPVTLINLRVNCLAGVFFQAQGGATQARWTVVIGGGA